MKKLKFFFALIFIISSHYSFNKINIEKICIEGCKDFDFAWSINPDSKNWNYKGQLLNKKCLDNAVKMIPSGSTVIDIGAHMGFTSVFFSLCVGPKGKVFSFEPNPKVFEVLKLNSTLHPTIIPTNKAITTKPGIYNFNCNTALNNGGIFDKMTQNKFLTQAHPVSFQVEGINLEEWLEQNAKDSINDIKFIKIDTEGHDKEILKSIRNLILKIKPIIQCELYPFLTENERAEFYDIIISLNYKPLRSEIGHYSHLKKFLSKEEFIKLPGCDFLCFPNVRKI